MPQHFVPTPSYEQNLLGRRQSVRPASRRVLGPWWRAFRLCVLAVLIPCLLVAGPLYMRYRVYYSTMYPLGISDMRKLNAHVSTTWCQGQVVRANTTFNAYVVNGEPGLLREPRRVSMSRQLILEDDMKEYWAFYLLRDSVVTVSTCVRWQGASLIIIKGHKHLRECAYIGDDSSEEEDELQEELAATLARNATSDDDPDSSNKTNTPDLMRRFRPEVVFHGPNQRRNSNEQLNAGSSSDSSDEDTALASVLLRRATEHAKNKLKANTKRGSNHVVTGSLDATPSTADTSGEVLDDILKKLKNLGPRGKNVLKKLNEQVELEGASNLLEKLESEPDETEQKKLGTSGLEVEPGGASGLEKLEPQPDEGAGQATPPSRRRRRGTVEMDAARKRREIYVKSASLRDMLNAPGAHEDMPIEELEPDGIADHHRHLNQTTAGDHSNSEVWSSFSSSEEALLQCAGLVLNLPLQPHRRCEAHRGPADHANAALHNTITYKVPNNGYYFFVFSSENEIQPNFISVQFELEKTVYDVSHPVAACRNTTGQCELPLGFWTYDTVVLELPVDTNSSLWSEEYFASSECQPRTAVYLACIISVPLLILIFAFH